MRFHPKTDANQPEIVHDLRRAGVSVWITSHMGGGFPDLVCGYHGITILVEVKNRGGKVTPDEAEFFRNWRGSAYFAETSDEVMKIFEDLMEEK